MINSLQAGRFLAAMAVVFHHAVISVAEFVDTPPRSVATFLDYGYLGVDFFFVLSGFIIHYTMTSKPKPALQFVFERLGRIFLPYWPIAVAMVAAYTILPQLSGSGREWGWLSSLTLFPTAFPPALSVAWTLQHELAFYLIYAMLFFSKRLTLGLSMWCGSLALANLTIFPEGPITKLLLDPINVEFIAGVAASHVFNRLTLDKLKYFSFASIVLVFLFL